MSFDIHLQTHNYTREMRDFTNPFTGEATRGPVDAGVSVAERQALVEFFAAAAPNGADEFGCIVLELRDGGSAEVFVSKLYDNEPFTGCMFAIRSAFTPMLLDAIWRVGNLGRMSMFATMEDSKPIVTDAEHRKLLPNDWDGTVVCESPEQLGLLLEKGFAEWHRFRQQVMDT